MTDLEIANSVKLKPIKKVAKKLGYKSELFCYGEYKAKLNLKFGKKNGKVILVTAITPTKLGIGKTTVSIGLADALNMLNKNASLALREPSLGPVFGIKGGATGGGQSQIAPMEDINLHFNGDFSAITSANNLLCSLIDNHIFQGNELEIDANNILFHRCLDLNDRALRKVTVMQGEKNGMPREEEFTITAACEVMSIMCLAKDFEDLKQRLGNISVALNKNGKIVKARDLNAQESMAILLKDAFKPNLVQTLYGSPAIVHCGPFANISTGCNSIVATKMAMSYSNYVVTEAGFGADLGAEKFLNVKCRVGNIKPSCVVLVATIKALKLHGGMSEEEFNNENVQAIEVGLDNLRAHINSLKNNFNVPVVVTLNKYETDTQAEVQTVVSCLKEEGVECVINNVWAEGGKGAIDLAKAVLNKCEQENNFKYIYNLTDSIKEKIYKVATKVYGASNVEYSEKAEQQIENAEKLGFTNLPVVIAKTQNSLSDNKKLINAPKNFTVKVREIQVKTGAGFIVVLMGNMLLMPGLNKTPNALSMEIDSNLNIKGIF